MKKLFTNNYFHFVLFCIFLLAGCKDPKLNIASQNKIQPAANTNEKLPTPEGRWIEGKENIVYIPSIKNPREKFPVVIVFSPDGNARATLEYWKSLADEKKYILIGSKIYQNGNYTDEQMLAKISKNHSMVFNSLKALPIQPQKIILAGLSGGGSFSHALNINRPGSYNTLIVNCGRIWEPDYEKAEKNFQRLKNIYSNRQNKIVFLASPTDFRYEEMKRDNQLMQKLGWKTYWIEFEGGHRMAPMEKYGEALGVI
ncbi:MAG: hypothetical protein SFU25_11370 [Candidatus Caenarcaniphilales bacterium]|nr:hypothetical protein [Candidatus Caenarcaniphilales bacterium]